MIMCILKYFFELYFFGKKTKKHHFPFENDAFVAHKLKKLMFFARAVYIV